MACVDRTGPFVFQGYCLVNSSVSSLRELLEVVSELPDAASSTDTG
jgi:hypothetical protein